MQHTEGLLKRYVEALRAVAGVTAGDRGQPVRSRAAERDRHRLLAKSGGGVRVPGRTNPSAGAGVQNYLLRNLSLPPTVLCTIAHGLLFVPAAATTTTHLVFCTAKEVRCKVRGVMKTPSKPGRWASARALTRYDAVRFLEEAVRSGLIAQAGSAARPASGTWGGRIYKVLDAGGAGTTATGTGASRPCMIERAADKGDGRTLSPEAIEALLAMRRAQPELYVATLLRQLERQGTIPARQRQPHDDLPARCAPRDLDRASMKSAGSHGADEGLRGELGQPALDDRRDVGAECADRAKAASRSARTCWRLIDDCSRLCPARAVLSRPRRSSAFWICSSMRCFRAAFPEKLYTDNGIAVHQRASAHGVRQLRHPADPCQALCGLEQGQDRAVLPDRSKRLRAAPGVRAGQGSLAELNRRFWQWLESEYHQRSHRALDGQSPQERFQERSEGLRTVPPGMDVDGLFLKRTTRRVRRDATISLNGRMFEVPVSLRGRIVEVRFDPFALRADGTVSGGKESG